MTKPNMAIAIEEIEQLDYSDLIDTGSAMIPMPYPGQILDEEFLKPMAITQYRLAKSIGVSQRRISEIISGHRAITVDTGLRLSRFFGLSENYWLRLQLEYDIDKTKRNLIDVLPVIHPFKAQNHNYDDIKC